MKRTLVHQQIHGYRKGHQLLSSSMGLSPKDQDTIDRLSDMAGPLRPGEVFEPYLTAYPLPGGSHYVVGRTFQDLTAVRSGCVVTRSVLISLADWAELDSVEGILSILVAPGREEEAKDCEVSVKGAPPAKVKDPRVLDLVEAVFFEEPQPVVYFEAVEADAIASCLLVSLWPSLRCKFAVCTYTLGPRRIGETYFDLVFAPVTARARFLDFPQRRIGAGVPRFKEPKSRWSRPTAFHIFGSERPSVVANDPLGVLAHDKDGDRAKLRLVLLWNDLAARAEETPRAVLGMLDILNARDGNQERVWNALLPTIIHAVDMAIHQLSTGDAWTFLLSLEVKVSIRRRSPTLMSLIEGAVCGLADRDISEALAHLETETRERTDVPPHALKGLADGVAKSELFPDVLEWLGGIPPSVVLRMLDGSEAFLRRALEALRLEPDQWIRVFSRVFDEPEPVLLTGVRRKLTHLVDVEVAETITQVMLDRVSSEELVELVAEIGARRDFASGVFDEAIVKAAKGSGGLELVRDAVANRFSGKGADRFLLATLELNKSAVEWLEGAFQDSQRATRLLIEVVEAASDNRIREMSSDEGLLRAVLKLLAHDCRSGARQMARILLLGVVAAEQAIDYGFRVLTYLPQRERDELGKWILREALGGTCVEDQRVSDLLSQYGTKMHPNELVKVAVKKSAPSKRVGSNIVMLNAGPPRLRSAVVAQIDALSAYLVERPQEDLGQAAYIAWATMIKDSKTEGREIQIRAARTVFHFALGMLRYPVSSLIVESFPIVYEEKAMLRDSGRPDWVSTWDMYTSHLWLANKRSKRRSRGLVVRLVDAFMKSRWPPAELLVVAIQVGVVKKVVRRIRSKSSGELYLADIRHDASRLERTLRGQILKQLSDSA